MASLCHCGRAFDVAAAFDSLPGDAMGRSGHFSMNCPSCGAGLELRLYSGRIASGYSYWAGSMHFEEMRSKKVPGLTVTASEPDNLEVALGTRHWHFGVPSRVGAVFHK